METLLYYLNKFYKYDMISKLKKLDILSYWMLLFTFTVKHDFLKQKCHIYNLLKFILNY